MGGGQQGTLMGGEDLFNGQPRRAPQPDPYGYGVGESGPESFTIPRNDQTEKQVKEFLDALKRLNAIDTRKSEIGFL